MPNPPPPTEAQRARAVAREHVAVLTPSITWQQWESRVVEWAKGAGWLCYKTPRPKGNRRERNSDVGFPDVVMVKGGRCICAELKSGTARLTPEQVQWRDALKAAGVEWYLWHPDNEQAVLAALKGAAQ